MAQIECLYYTPDEVCEIIGVDRRTLATMERKGDCPAAVRFTAHMIRYPKKQIHDWLDRLNRAAMQAAPVGTAA